MHNIGDLSDGCGKAGGLFLLATYTNVRLKSPRIYVVLFQFTKYALTARLCKLNCKYGKLSEINVLMKLELAFLSANLSLGFMVKNNKAFICLLKKINVECIPRNIMNN